MPLRCTVPPEREIRYVKTKIRNHALLGKYKFNIYLKLNPNLEPSPLLTSLHPAATDITRFRLGSHKLPIETGRWNRTPREQRFCTACNVLGDEEHVLFNCSLVNREGLVLYDISRIWYQPDVFELFKRIKMADYL